MRVGFLFDKQPPEDDQSARAALLRKYDAPLKAALRKGVVACGDEYVRVYLADVAAARIDVGVIWGVKSRERFFALREKGVPTVVFDKGYVSERTHYFRVAVNGMGPGRYMMRVPRPGDRWKGLPWSHVDAATLTGRGDHVLLALSSQKYCDFYELGDATKYATSLVSRIRNATDRPIIYRPKPSWLDKFPMNNLTVDDVAIPGTELSIEHQLRTDLARTWVTVTHGSGVAVDSILYGIPAITLCPDAVAAPVSGNEITTDSIERPYWAENRRRWAKRLAYTQWTIDEIGTGEAWRCIKEDLAAAVGRRMG